MAKIRLHWRQHGHGERIATFGRFVARVLRHHDDGRKWSVEVFGAPIPGLHDHPDAACELAESWAYTELLRALNDLR